MFDTDEELIATALSLWGNYIETGNVSLSRNDAIQQGNEKIIKPLTDSQLKMVERIRKLSIETLDKKSDKALNVSHQKINTVELQTEKTRKKNIF